MSRRPLLLDALFIVAGMLVGVLIVAAAGAVVRSPERDPAPMARRPPEVNALQRKDAPRPHGSILLVWSPGGLPRKIESIVEGVEGVREATTVLAGLDWLHGSRSRDGGVVDRPPKGFAIPFELAVVDPREYASFVRPGDQELILALRPGQALLAQTAFELRGSSDGLSLRLGRGTTTVAGVVADEATNGYEAIVPGPPRRADRNLDEFLLVRTRSAGVRGALGTAIRRHLGPGSLLRIRTYGETPFLRYGDSVLPQLSIKDAFGEFAASPRSDGTITIEQGWMDANIRTVELPVIGRVTCHRSLLPQLRAAMMQVVREGLAHAVDPAQFAGCFGPRFINSNPGGRLSHHSWGVAVDLNYADNPMGVRPRQDRRLVAIMEDHGFTWGGRWLVPDGMHFEWARFP